MDNLGTDDTIVLKETSQKLCNYLPAKLYGSSCLLLQQAVIYLGYCSCVAESHRPGTSTKTVSAPGLVN